MRPLLILLASAGAAHAQTVLVDGAWARATLPHQNSAAAYLTLLSPSADALTGVDTSQAGMAMLHVTTRQGMRASMDDTDSIPLPAGQKVALAPGGTHIMLMDLKAPLRAGDTLRLHLTFAHAAPRDITVPVRPVTATGP